jgi:hypothetical protein
MVKPEVGKDCVLDPTKYVSYAIPAPLNLQAVPSGSAWVDLTWEEPPVGTGPAIKNYRLFINDPQNTFQGLTIETTDSNTSYRLNTPEPMRGKFYAATVQAINKIGKLSQLSEPAVFEVKVQTLKPNITPAAKPQSPPAPAPVPLPKTQPTHAAPKQIAGLRATEANADKIVLEWDEPADAAEYKIYWDRGNNETRVLQLLQTFKGGVSQFTIDHSSSAGIMGSDYIEQHGEQFRFQLSYIWSTNHEESPRTDILKVPVAALPARTEKSAKDQPASANGSQNEAAPAQSPARSHTESPNAANKNAH